MTKFDELPKVVQEDIKEMLKAYPSVNVWYENGRYSYVDCIAAHYAPDHRYIGTYNKDDVYTKAEQIENYINEFHDFPSEYKGARDYAMLNKMDNERETEAIGNGKLRCTDWYGKLNNKGNFELVGKRTVIF